MRIGIIAPPWLPVPPPAYGGTETVIDNLARGLQALGHNVLLYTVGESSCPVPRAALYADGPSPIGTSVEEAAHVLAAYDALSDVDIIHDHTTLGPLLAWSVGRRRLPIITTHHGAFTAENRRILAATAQHAAIVAISHSQAGLAGAVPISAVIHHGIDLDTYRSGPGGGDYLLFIGRMSADKGVHRAVRIAHRAGRRLIIAAKMREPAEEQYFTSVVRPLLGSDDQVLIEPPLRRRLDLLRHADALINPISWPEPFGLVMAEALASGTPVLAGRHGAAPEIVDHACTGFLCDDEDAMVRAVGRVGDIDRARCRNTAETRFSLKRMSEDYARLYRETLAAWHGPWHGPVSHTTSSPPHRAALSSPVARLAELPAS